MTDSLIHDHAGTTRDQHGEPVVLRAFTGHPLVVYGTILQQILVWRLCAVHVHLMRQAQLQVMVKEWITIRMNW